METVIVAVILAVIVSGAVWYICRAKKRGVKCVGCPHGGKCGDDCSCCGKTE